MTKKLRFLGVGGILPPGAIGPELWEVDDLGAPLRRVEEWTPVVAAEFASWCADRYPAVRSWAVSAATAADEWRDAVALGDRAEANACAADAADAAHTAAHYARQAGDTLDAQAEWVAIRVLRDPLPPASP